MNLRQPQDADYPDIYQLLERAFAPSVAEANLVRSLKSSGQIAFDLLIERHARIAGYICYSSALDNAGTMIGYHLAPLAVIPEKQRQGIGHRLTSRSLKLLPKKLPVYVLGDPDYYKRFGFRIDKTQKCLFDPEGGHFLVLSPGPLPPRDILYENAFYELAGQENEKQNS